MYDPGTTDLARRDPAGSTDLAERTDALGMPPPTPSKGIGLRLLSRFRLEVHGQPELLCSRAERVLVLLAIHGGTVRRGTIAGTLWPETTGERALTSLRAALWELNRSGLPLVHAGANTLCLGADVEVDLGSAVTTAAVCLGTCPGR